MKVKVPTIFQELNLSDRQSIFAELLYNLHKSYTGNWWFVMHPKDIKIILREDSIKYKLTNTFLTKLFKGLIEFVEIGDEQWLVRIATARPQRLPTFEHELKDLDAIKVYCYMLGRLAAGVVDDEFNVDVKTRHIHVNGKRGAGVITPYQIEQLNA